MSLDVGDVNGLWLIVRLSENRCVYGKVEEFVTVKVSMNVFVLSIFVLKISIVPKMLVCRYYWDKKIKIVM